MSKGYEEDVLLWAQEQVALLRSGKFAALDIEHIAEEIEDVGKSEQRELANRMAVLLAHLLKWRYQPERRGVSWQRTIKHQRERIMLALQRTPSLKVMLATSDWQREIWLDALDDARQQTGLDVFPEDCPWSMDQVMAEEFFPED
ncbi:DUF29 domain-containing protein [Acidithiobacillus sp. IBUN Pt1247-S3]|uniref:DUF29 domain-containing protein n=1 Tax=Acidithiobacillus sp. IBUN Pt1247-S3 TaxID=3166642 RepID=UPI0034E4A2B8